MKITHTSKWIGQRITAVILIPLTFWFIYQCISFQSMSYGEIINFFQSYINSFLFLIMMTAMMIHAKLGCETIVQDYVTSESLTKTLYVIINFIALMSLLLSLLAIVWICLL